MFTIVAGVGTVGAGVARCAADASSQGAAAGCEPVTGNVGQVDRCTAASDPAGANATRPSLVPA